VQSAGCRVEVYDTRRPFTTCRAMDTESGQTLIASDETRRDATANSRYEVAPRCWITAIVAVVTILLSVLIVDVVLLVRSDQALFNMNKQTLKLEEVRVREACRVGADQALMSVHSYFPEDIKRLKSSFQLEAENSQSTPAEQWSDWWEWADKLECTVNGAAAYPNLDDDGQPSYSYNGEFADVMNAPAFCNGLVTEVECDGTKPQSVQWTSWISSIVKHRTLLIQKLRQKSQGNCMVLQSEFDGFYKLFASKYRNPCEWTASPDI